MGFVRIIAFTEQIAAGEDREETVQVTIQGERSFPFGVAYILPSRFPSGGYDSASVRKCERAFGHVAENIRLSPHIPRVVIQLGTNCGKFRPGLIAFIVNHASHASLHVVQEVAVEKPVTKFIRVELDHCGGHGSDVNGVFEWGMAAMPLTTLKKWPWRCIG